MPEPFAELQKIFGENATKLTEVLKVPFTAPLAVGGQLIETAQAALRGGQAGRFPTPQMLMQQTAKMIQQTSPMAILGKGSEIVGERKETYPGRESRTTIF